MTEILSCIKYLRYSRVIGYDNKQIKLMSSGASAKDLTYLNLETEGQ